MKNALWLLFDDAPDCIFITNRVNKHGNFFKYEEQ